MEGAAPEEVAAEVRRLRRPRSAGSADDFTEDLLGALAADEPVGDGKLVLVGMDNPEESSALPSYGQC